MLKIKSAQDPEDNFIFALYDYQSPLIKKIIWLSKYRHQTSALEQLAFFSKEIIIDKLSDKYGLLSDERIVLVPVPIFKDNKKIRGYNQSEVLTKALSNSLNWPTDLNLLIKNKFTPSQAHIKKRNDRLLNIKNTMILHHPINTNALYIIVDDVTTTGATLNECRRVISEAGGKSIGLALAHGYFWTNNNK